MTETRTNVAHYNTGEIETIDFIADKLTPEEFRAYVLGNIIKYASRAPHKGQFDDDIEKIRNYAVILQEHTAKLAAKTEVPALTYPDFIPAAKIEAGSRVRVIDDHHRLPLGSEHTVAKVDDSFVYLEGSEDDGWWPERFEVTTASYVPYIRPRVWEQLSDVPEDVKVKDKDDDIYKYDAEEGYWRWGVQHRDPGTPTYDINFDMHAPFTEVLD